MAESMKVISLDPGALEGIQMVRDAARDCGEMQTAIMRYLEEVAFTGQAKRAIDQKLMGFTRRGCSGRAGRRSIRARCGAGVV
ncbi:hypothetical protein ACFU51_37920, partial [Streptomyces sp. NPDC057430]|uniref:hypothetical protein n=1 Tax=Streptomyces sp. NPDC057430 TaxID=3346131 RepID=UPI00369A7892